MATLKTQIQIRRDTTDNLANIVLKAGEPGYDTETKKLAIGDSDTPFSALQGRVMGPNSSTDNALARFDGTTGQIIQNSSVTVNDSGNLTATKLITKGSSNQYVLLGDGTTKALSDFALDSELPDPTDYYWANVKVSASSDNSTVPTFSPTFKYKIATHDKLNPAADWVMATPIAKYLWHDLLAFNTATFEQSTNGSTWTTSTNSQYTQSPTNQKENQTIEVVNSTNRYARWTWAGSWHACQAQWLVIGFTWQQAPALCNIILESYNTPNSTTPRQWVTVLNTTATGNASPVWFKLDPVWTNCDRIRLTIQWNSSTTHDAKNNEYKCSISSVKFLTARWGNQGYGSELEKPYSWDNNANLYRRNESSTLGLLGAPWQAIYGTTLYQNGTKLDSLYAKLNHAGTSTTYGLGTTTNYGHVKISNGDVNGVGHSDGLVAGMDHSHSNYALTSDIPTVNNGKLTIQKNGTTVATFTANQSGNTTANITVPTKVSDLNNDSGFLTAETDTLQTVTTRGATTDKSITTVGLTTTSTLYVTGTAAHREGIRITPYGELSSIWWNATGTQDYTKGQMWGITAYTPSYTVDTSKRNTFRFRGPTSTTADSATDQMWINTAGLVTSRGGFAKSGKSDNEVLLAGGGTKALSDFQERGNYVTLDTAQTITGAKTFDNHIYFTNVGNSSTNSKQIVWGNDTTKYGYVTASTANQFGFGVNNTTIVLIGENYIGPNTSLDNEADLGRSNGAWRNLYIKNKIINGSNEYTLPSKTGTIALTNDIPSVSGFVTGPSSSTDNAITRYNGTTGKIVQNSNATLDDSGNLKIAGNFYVPAQKYAYFGTNKLATFRANDNGAFIVGAYDDIYFRGNLDSNDSAQATGIQLSKTYLKPEATNTMALGASDKIWSNVYSRQLTSTVATGTAPLVVTSTTAVTNLNADMLDGKHASSFQAAGNYVTIDTAQTITGDKTFTGSVITTNNKFEIKANSNTDDSWIKLTNKSDAGYYAFGIRRPYDTYGLQLKIHPASGTDTYYDIWHAGNDGSGSGLDADLLDGKHASAFALTSDIPDVSDFITEEVDTLQSVTNRGNTTTNIIKIQNGDAGGSFVLGANVNSTTLTANNRKLGRMGVPSYDSTTKTVAGISFDSQQNVNLVDFGGHPNNAQSIAPDVIRFVVANSHNNAADGARTLALQISKQNGLVDSAGGGTSVAAAKFFIPVQTTSSVSSDSGFIKTGSSDSYVLLAGGGTKAISDFASADIGDDYLPLAGGTMTGAIVRNYNSASTDPVLKIGSNNFDINIFKVYSADQTYKATGVYGYNLTYNGTGSGVANALTMYCDNQNASTQVIGWQLNQAGQMGIGVAASTSYRLTVNGSANATTLYENGTSLTNKYVSYTKNNNVSVAGTTKTTYTYGQTAIFAPNGLIMGGTAAAAGLVTRGICGVSTPNATTGACTKDNLYLNFDGGSTTTWTPNGRGVIINAGTPGEDLGSGMYSYCAVRGDIVKAWVEAKGYITSSSLPTVNNGTLTIQRNGTTVATFTANDSDNVTANIIDNDTLNTAGSTNDEAKLYLIGAKSQAASAQTYSDAQVYTQAGELNATSVCVAEHGQIRYDATNECIRFVIA